MTKNPLFPSFDRLSPTLPVFPLGGVLLLPRGLLPLNVFEPRYLAMIDDALASDRLIGMVQPVNPASRAPAPELYRTGCAGRITSFDETEDGRYLVTLTGVCRFRIGEELPTVRGYRRVRADWTPFRDDMDEACGPSLDRARLGRALTRYFQLHGIQANWEAIDSTPEERLITSLCMICPFEPPEKEALLEARTLAERAELMLSLIEMAVLGKEGGDSARH